MEARNIFDDPEARAFLRQLKDAGILTDEHANTLKAAMRALNADPINRKEERIDYISTLISAFNAEDKVAVATAALAKANAILGN